MERMLAGVFDYLEKPGLHVLLTPKTVRKYLLRTVFILPVFQFAGKKYAGSACGIARASNCIICESLAEIVVRRENRTPERYSQGKRFPAKEAWRHVHSERGSKNHEWFVRYLHEKPCQDDLDLRKNARQAWGW